jgi:RHS repeat-associated protein
LGTYQQVSTTHLCGNYWFQPLRTNVYFAGKLVHFKNFTTAAEEAVVVDRLGSVVRGENVSGSLTSYYPYGEQKGASNLLPDKFATYLRDDYTGLDYAHNRYYASTLGRFTSPDPCKSGKSDNPGSWNRYPYVLNDPVDLNDPAGLDTGCEQDCYMDWTGHLTCYS